MLPPYRIRIVFDDTAWWPMPDCSFLPPSPSTWACGNSSTITDLGGAPGRANTGDKMLTLVASALAGGTASTNALRAGGTVSVLGCMVKAPLGTFLRSFRGPSTRPREPPVAGPGMGRGAGPGDSPLTIDLD